MARFIPGVLGTPIGKTDGKVFRQVNGKTFFSFRPDTYNISQTKSAKNSRQAFGTVVQFAKLITSSDELSYCWKKAKIKGTSAYHRILKHNLPLTKDGLLSIRNQMIPKGFDYTFNCDLNEDSTLLFNLDLSNAGLTLKKFALNAYFIIALFNPASKKSGTEFLVSTIELEQVDNLEDINFNISFSTTEKKIINKYKNLIVFSALIINSKGKFYNHSASISKEFSIK
ncbi:MAG: hypothetical protein WAU11_00870 [Ignavibacteriaceae bacterium]